MNKWEYIHTGKGEFDKIIIRDFETHEYVCEIEVCRKDGRKKAMEITSLIIAAPNLLKSCKESVFYIERNGFGSNQQELLNKLNSAIEKAEYKTKN